jgi:hypothetical protein
LALGLTTWHPPCSSSSCDLRLHDYGK